MPFYMYLMLDFLKNIWYHSKMTNKSRNLFFLMKNNMEDLLYKIYLDSYVNLTESCSSFRIFTNDGYHFINLLKSQLYESYIDEDNSK